MNPLILARTHIGQIHGELRGWTIPSQRRVATNHPINRIEFVRKYLDGIFAEDVHAKRVMSLANGAVGVMAGASLAVSIIGQSLAQARGLLSKHAIIRTRSSAAR
jgi:hypothetical protein